MEKRHLIYLFSPLLILVFIVWVRQWPIKLGKSETSSDARAATNLTASDETVAVKSIYWSDADSGRINGDFKFRLNGIDAPETGGVGAAIGGAKCELERKLGFESKAWVVKITKNSELVITKQYGLDKYDRMVVDLNVNNIELAKSGIDAGYLKPWPHIGRRALTKKPDWCSDE